MMAADVGSAESSTSSMAQIDSTGVFFDCIAREWRFKWSAENNKESLASAQTLLEIIVPKIEAIDGVQSVQRMVCGDCLDFKVIVVVSLGKFGAWESRGFPPESEFIDAARIIDGVSAIETQTFTYMPAAHTRTPPIDPLTMIVQVEIVPNRIDDFLRVMGLDAAGSRQEPNCLRFDVLRVDDSTNKFVLYESYTDAAALAYHKTTEHYKCWSEFKASGGVASQVVVKTVGLDVTL
mmetsp:Transcript_30790/g.41675  ORF Transcript_30790/g.41675 Transcript_30790/m.41675 type:complete len:236 (-) Transcript_30790:386-1093(-)